MWNLKLVLMFSLMNFKQDLDKYKHVQLIYLLTDIIVIILFF